MSALELVGYERVRELFPEAGRVSYRTLRRMSDLGDFPSYARLSPRQPVLWPLSEVLEWLTVRLAPVVSPPQELGQ